MNHFLHTLIFISILGSQMLFAQNDSSHSKKCRRIVLLSSSTGLAAGSLIYLNQAWYKQYSTGKFHTFNDNAEWLQMDKAGHAWTTYHLGRLMMDAYDWSGFSGKQKLASGTIGFAYMTGVELMDGYSAGWGFSWGDIGANALGTGLAIGQEAVWDEQRVFIKYSYNESGFAKQNPSLLGSSITEKILKDYNAQTYWISISPFAFIKGDHKLPKWLAVSFGYGAQGMIGARGLPEWYVNPPERIRNYYFSLDIDLTKIKTKSKALKTIFTTLNMVKVPMPALGFNKYGTNFNWIR